MADRADSVFIYDPLEISPRTVVNHDQYWQRYGLKQSPFDDNSHFAMYYPAPHWQKPLNFLLQFCSGSHVIGIVEGELGIGKTMLLAQLIAQLDENVEYCHIEGKTGISVPQLISRIAESFHLSRLDQSTWHEQLQTELTMLQQRQKVGLLIIDDADRLPGETLTALIDLATMQRPDQIYLYIVLTSELQLGEYLENLAQEQGRPLHIPAAHLTAFNLEETKNYLKHRLVKAGLTEKLPFNNDMIAKIYQLSRGFPGRINRVAQQMLIDALKPNEERLPLVNQQHNKTGMLWRAHNIKIISAMMLILVVAIFWKLQPQLEKTVSLHRSITPNKPAMMAQANQTSAVSATPLASQPILVPADNNNVIVPPAAATTPPVIAANISSIAAAQLQPQPPASLQPLPNQNDVAQSATANNTEATDNPTATSSNTLTNVMTGQTISVSAKPITAKNLSTDEKRLLEMQGFTMQLLGSRNPSDLKRLIAKAHLDTAQVFQFRTQYQNKPWYVLIYGDYNSAQAAKTAIAKLPANLKNLHPWVRPMASVHDAIKAQ